MRLATLCRGLSSGSGLRADGMMIRVDILKSVPTLTYCQNIWVPDDALARTAENTSLCTVLRRALAGEKVDGGGTRKSGEDKVVVVVATSQPGRISPWALRGRASLR